MRCCLCLGYLMLLGKPGQTKQCRSFGCGMTFSRVARRCKPPGPKQDTSAAEDKAAQSKKSRGKCKHKEP